MFKKIIFLPLLCLFFFPSIMSCQSGRALVLDGCTNYIEVTENNLLDHDEALSIECWIQPNCDVGNNIILSKQWCEGQYGYYLSVNEGRLFWSYSRNGLCNIRDAFRTQEITIETNAFSHVAVVHTRSTIRLFVNGKETVSEQVRGLPGQIFNNNQSFKIGAYKRLDGAMTNHYSGLIDELRVWNIELNEASITDRMNINLDGDEDGLVLYFDMEDIGVANDLTLVNRSTFGDQFNGVAKGSTNWTPYTIDPSDYENQIVNLGGNITTCEGEVQIGTSLNDYKSLSWNNGVTSSTLVVSQSGEYILTVERELCKFYTDTILVSLTDETILSNQYIICEGDSVFAQGSIYVRPGIFYDTLRGNGECDTIIETLVAVQPIEENSISFSICPDDTLIYDNRMLTEGNTRETIVYRNQYGCDSILNINITTDLVLKDSTSLTACTGATIDFNGVNILSGTTETFFLTSEKGCDSIFTVSVDQKESNSGLLINDTIVCTEYFQLESSSDSTFWNDGTLSKNKIINESGLYTAIIVDDDGCEIVDTVQVEFLNSDVYVPNAFSPNQDGQNDCFRPYFPLDLEIEDYELSVFSRWGELLTRTNDVNYCWGGEFKDETLNPGVFVWMIKWYDKVCQESRFMKGDVTLLK